MNRQDEVSLYELWSVLVKRKLLFLSIFVVVLLSGVVLTALRQHQYRYTQAIRPVSYFQNGVMVSLVPPVRSKLW